MKNKTLFILIFAAMVLQSCLYSKKAAIKKFCNQDSVLITTTIHDTIYTNTVEIDSVFSEKIDSVYLVKDKIEIRYVKKFGRVYLEGKCKGDTIYYTKTITVTAPCINPKLVWYKQYAADYWYILPLLLLLFLGVKYFHKILNNE